MKKNRMMRLASLLLVLVLMTSSVVGGTFAKYTSQATTTDTARVAKWGWGSTSISIDLFDATYDSTVQSADSANVIAPGTKKSATIIWAPDSTFAPEVDYELTFALAGNIPAEIETELNWTLTENGTETKYDTFAELQNAIKSVKYDGEASAVGPTVTVQIGWEWPFNGGDDTADTALGNATTLAQLQVDVTMTATQKD